MRGRKFHKRSTEAEALRDGGNNARGAAPTAAEGMSGTDDADSDGDTDGTGDGEDAGRLQAAHWQMPRHERQSHDAAEAVSVPPMLVPAASSSERYDGCHLSRQLIQYLRRHPYGKTTKETPREGQNGPQHNHVTAVPEVSAFHKKNSRKTCHFNKHDQNAHAQQSTNRKTYLR